MLEWSEHLADRRILVTGGHGFIGQAACRALARRSIAVLAPTRAEVDLTDKTAVAACVQTFRPSHILHLAGSTNRASDLALLPDLVSTNISATANLVAVLPRGAVLLHSGTMDEYGQGAAPFQETEPGQPLTPYSASKAAAGLLVVMAGGVHARLALVYGPGQGSTFFVPQLLHSLVEDRDFAMTAGEQVRDLIFLDDVIEGLLRLLACPEAGGHIVNLCSGRGTALKDLVLIAKKVAQRSGRVHLGAMAYRPKEVFEVVGSPHKLQSLVGWVPQTPLEDGLRQTLSFLHPVGGQDT